MDHQASIRKSGKVFSRSGCSGMGKIRQRNMGDARAEIVRGVEDVVLRRPRPGDEDSSRTRIRRRLAEMGDRKEEDQESGSVLWMVKPEEGFHGGSRRGCVRWS